MESLKRRKFIGMAVAAAGALTVGSLGGLPMSAFAADSKNDKAHLGTFLFSQDPLPYKYNALEPSIDALTMEIHYTKHHAGYIKNVNEAIKAENLNYTSAADFFAHSSGMSAKARNNSGGAWNHNFFWASMTPSSSAPIPGKLKKAIESSFGSIDAFKAEFAKAALGQFGSGWAWLISDKGKLKIVSTPNQDNPLMDNAPAKGTPLLAIDVWEHAYYLKYQNKRADYITAFWNVVNWKEVDKRLV